MPHQCTACDRVFDDGSKEMLSGCPDCGGNTFQYLPDGAGGAVDADATPPERPGTDSTVARSVGKAATTLRDVVSRRSDDDRSATDDGLLGSDRRDVIGAGGTDAGSEAGETAGAGDTGLPEEMAETTVSAGESTADGSVDATDAEFLDDDSTEDLAQSSARSDVVSRDELPTDPAEVAQTTVDSPEAGDATGDARAGDAPEGSRAADGSPDDGTPAPPSDGRVVDTPSEEDDRPDLSELRAELNEQFEAIRIVDRGQYELNLMELYERDVTIIALQENGRYVIEPPESWRGEGSG